MDDMCWFWFWFLKVNVFGNVVDCVVLLLRYRGINVIKCNIGM